MEEEPRIALLRHEVSLLRLDQKRLQSILSSENYRDCVKHGVREELRELVDSLAELIYELNGLESEQRT